MSKHILYIGRQAGRRERRETRRKIGKKEGREGRECALNPCPALPSIPAEAVFGSSAPGGGRGHFRMTTGFSPPKKVMTKMKCF
jgi:hypothetical protein